MRDMYMVSNAPAANGNTPLLAQELTPEQELAARFRLLQALQTTLNYKDLLSLFFKNIQALVSISGLTYLLPQEKTALRFGRDSTHHCDYQLRMDDGPLGTIVFSRQKRFSEEELGTLEHLLSYLVHPLRNAINYDAALRLTMLDPLTMVGNRTALDSALRRELQLAERHHQDLSLLMIDVDHFKKINDKYGHVRGDQVLKEIAKAIQTVCRSSDVTFRFGGEEFVVLLGKTDKEGANIIAERLRARIAEIEVKHLQHSICPTVSIGIASLKHKKNTNVEELFEQADAALYKAKAQGRNQVVAI